MDYSDIYFFFIYNITNFNSSHLEHNEQLFISDQFDMAAIIALLISYSMPKEMQVIHQT